MHNFLPTLLETAKLNKTNKKLIKVQRRFPASMLMILGLWVLVTCLNISAQANATSSPAVLVTIAEAPGQQSSTVAGIDVFDFDTLDVGHHTNVVWEGVGMFDELLVHEGYFGFGAYDPSDRLNSRFNWNGWPGYSGSDPLVSATIITLNERSAYFGLYWSAGDGDDIIRFYDGNTLVAEFSTSTVVQSASLTADYYGDPNHNNQWNPYYRYNHTEPYAFINFYADGNTKWDTIVLTQTHDMGSGFETDNISTRVEPVLSSTDDISVVGNIIAQVSGTETTVVSNTSSTWDFSSSADTGSTESTGSDSGSSESTGSDSGSTESTESDSGSTESTESDSSTEDSGSN